MRRPRSASDSLAGLISLGLAACEGEPVAVARTETLVVWSETQGVVELPEGAVAVGPGAPGELRWPAGTASLTFRRGEDTLTLLDVAGPEVRLDPFLRAAGFEATPFRRWTLAPHTVLGATATAALVSSGRAWPARGTEAPAVDGPAAPGTWFVLWSVAGRGERWAMVHEGGPGDGGAIAPQGVLEGDLALSVETAGEVWVEVLPVVDDVPVPLPLGGGLAGGRRGVVVPVPEGAPFGLAARVVDRRAGRPGPDRDVVLPLAPGVRSVHLSLPEPEPMAPEPAAELTRAVPLGPPETAAVAWPAPEAAAFWGLGLTDPDGCVPGRHWVFGPRGLSELPLPAALEGGASFEGTAAAFRSSRGYSDLTASREPPAEMPDWRWQLGRAGLWRAPIRGCDAAPADEGLFVVLPAAGDPCDEGAVLGLAVADGCGRLAFQPAGAAPGLPACGSWRDGAFVDADGRAFQAVAVEGPEGRAAWRIDHPTGSFRLVAARTVRGSGQVPAEWPRRARRVSVTEHLERAGRPGEAILGTELPGFRGEPADGPWLEIGSDGGVVAAWPGAHLSGVLQADGAVRARQGACDEVVPAATLRAPAAAQAPFILRLWQSGPSWDGRTTVRVLTARLWP